MKTKKIALAAGCFWGVQHILDQVPGVKKTRVGYIGGLTDDPTYKDISTGGTGHAEAVEVEYDETEIELEELLDYFWRLHDPTQLNRQGADVGSQYRSAIFYYDDNQRVEAEKSKVAFDLKKVFPNPAVTQIEKAGTFYEGEGYHQKYFDKNGGHICHVLRPE